jgi:hypothetical protein
MYTMYSCSFTAQGITANQDLFELIVPSSKIAVIHEIRVGQTSDTGDAAEEILLITLKRGVGSTSGSSGSVAAATPVKLETGSATAGCTFDANNTTKMTSGTITNIAQLTWNVRGEFIFLPTPEARPIMAPSERFAVELAAPSDSITTHATLLFEEVG